MSQALAAALGAWLLDRSPRRDFLRRAAVVGAALSLDPVRYALRPGTAQELIASYALPDECPPGSKCTADAYVEMCCTINGGVNACPAGTIAGGWWKADGSAYCDGPRYYIDCVGTCTRCTTGCDQGFCPDCDSVPACGCADGDCGHRRVGCRTFRYGQCNQDVTCVGRLACRVVSCTPAWELDPSCTTTSATDNRTANHTAACLESPVDGPAVVAVLRARDDRGYLMVSAEGGVLAFGTAVALGDATRQEGDRVVAAVSPRQGGYWLATADGRVHPFGLPLLGSMVGEPLNAPVVGIAGTPSGAGYWLVASDGGVFNFGDAPFLGSTGDLRLNRPIVGMAVTPSGAGYWLAANDGGVFAFGDAPFLGSTGDLQLNQPVVAMARTSDGGGYWLVARDGGVFAFGTAGYFGNPVQLRAG